METLKLSDNMISVSTKSISDQYLQDTYKDGRIDQLTRINAELLAALNAIVAKLNEKSLDGSKRRAEVEAIAKLAIAKSEEA